MAFCCTVILAIVPLARAWEYRPASETLRFTVNLDLRPYWDGVVNIEEVAFDPAGSVEFRNLTLSDRAGRKWVSVKSAKCVYVKDQNDVTVTEVRVEQPHVTLWYDKGELKLPMQESQTQSGQEPSRSSASVQHIIVNDAALTIAGENFAATWDGFRITAAPAPERAKYNFKLTRRLWQSDIDANGSVDMDTRILIADVRADHTLSAGETATILRLYDVPVIHDVSGHVMANLRFAGSLDDSENFWPAGYVVMTNGTVNGDGGHLLENLRSRITFLGQKLIVFETIECSALSGRFHGVGFVTERYDGEAWFGGHIAAADVNLAQFCQAIGSPGFFTRGTASARYDFMATSRALDDHSGEGVVFVDNADVWKMPVISHLFKFFGTPLTYSDGTAYFRTSGAAFIVKNARISSPMTAIEFQKNSFVNVQTEFVDAHAVFVPLRKLRTIGNMIPFYHIFANLSANLTRVSIRGFWSEPPSKLIRKEVIEDISASTINFFTDAAASGGQAGTDVLNRLKPLFATPSSSEATFELNGGP